MTDNDKRCVITGLGLVCAIGNNVNEAWNNAVNSVSGIRKTHSLDTEGCYADLAAEVNPEGFTVESEEQDLDRAVIFARKAAREATDDADIDDFHDNPLTCVILGSCVGGAQSISDYYRKEKDPSCILKMPISSIAPAVAASCHPGGVVTNIANACAAGTISIAYACELIRAGKADTVLAGGTDTFADVPYAGFLSLHALDAKGCSPFNRCEGITLGEGSGMLVVESYEHAIQRGAHIYCEVLGSGVSSDAYHITAPREDGEGQMEAIRRAITNSGIYPEDIGYVNAHGTGTGLNDHAEFLSLHTIFDETNSSLSVSSTKAMTGHCLGAAGAIEAVLAVKSLTTDTVLPTLGFNEEDMIKLSENAGSMDFCPNTAHRKELKNVMSNSFAFGGNNASIIFGKGSGNVQVYEKKKPVFITGIGSIMQEKGNPGSSPSRDDFDEVGLKSSFYRKLDNFSKLQVISGMKALIDGRYTVDENNAKDIGIIVGTSEGALGTCCEFQEHITEKGNAAGNAFKFPNTVYNAAGGYLSICSGIKGYNVTVTNGAQSGLSSIAYAMTVIRSGQEKAMLAAGTDENSPVITELLNKSCLSGGSVSLLLEDADAAKNRGADVYCSVIGYGMAHQTVPFGTLKGTEKALENAIHNALIDADLEPVDIDVIYGFANGVPEIDAAQKNVLENIFGEKLNSMPVFDITREYGDARSASAARSAANAAGMIKALAGGSSCNVLVISYGSGGSYCAIILSNN